MPSTTSLMRAAVLAGVASALPELAPRQMVTSSCADVHIFLGKGNNEPYPGRQGKLVSAICNGLSSCDYEDIQMQNMLEDNYCSAVTEGTTNGIAQIVAYNKRCPDSKLVVSGFSQGAQVVGDIFAGAGGTFFQGCVEPSIAALDRKSAAGKQIAAILTFGDVRHTANQPYGYLGGASKWGLFPRDSQQLANALNFAGVWRDYCNTEDKVCAGGNSVDEHLDYFDVYTGEAAGWVQGKVAAFQGPSPTGGSPAQTSAPAPTSMRSPYSNSTATDGASYVTTVTLDGGIVYTTVCPATQTTVPNPTTVVPPPDHSATATCPSPLPEATHSATENLSAIPTTAAPTGPAGTGGVPVPPKTTPTGVATVSGSAANFVHVGLCAIVAGVAGFAALL